MKREMTYKEFYAMKEITKPRLIDKIVDLLEREGKPMRVRQIALALGIENIGMTSNVIKKHNGKELLKKRHYREVWVGLNKPK